MRVSEATKAWGTWNVSVKSLSSAAPRRSAPPRRNVAQPQCAAAAPQLCCSCAAAVLQLRCGCAAAALRLCCSCAAAVLQLRCCCAAAALLLCCSFRADTNERVPPREYQRGDGPELVYQGGRRHSRGGPAWRPSGGVGQRRAPNVGEECPPAAPSGSSLALRWVRRQKARLTSEVTPRRGGGPARMRGKAREAPGIALRLGWVNETVQLITLTSLSPGLGCDGLAWAWLGLAGLGGAGDGLGHVQSVQIQQPAVSPAQARPGQPQGPAQPSAAAAV
eukprot:gene13845-biopygen1466